MDFINHDMLLFFNKHQTALPLYEVFDYKVLTQFPDSRIKVQKTQITFFRFETALKSTILKNAMGRKIR